MKRLNLLIFVILTLLTAGCSQQTISNPSPIPIPNANISTPWFFGTYYHDISAAEIEAYIQYYYDNQWNLYDELTWEDNEFIRDYVFIKDDMVTQINTYILNDTERIGNTMIVKSDQNISVAELTKRKNAISKSQAITMIQPVIDGLVTDGSIPDNKGITTNLIEHYSSDIFDKMGVQLFTALGDWGYIGNFLVTQDDVCYVFGTLDNFCVADTNQDGVYEFWNSYGWGSGIYRIELAAYLYDVPIWSSSFKKQLHRAAFETLVPNNGYGALFFDKIDDNTIHVWEQEWTNDNSLEELVKAKNYGIIQLDQFNHFDFSNLDIFPYKSWIMHFDQGRLAQIDKIIPESPPEIILTIDDMPIEYVTNLSHWNGEQNSKTQFSELMNDTSNIPLFTLTSLSEPGYIVTIDFEGAYNSPDSIVIKDHLIGDHGNQLYSNREIIDRHVEILEDGKFTFGLTTHFAELLSSDSTYYEKPHNRGFRIVCSWGENECVYSFVLRTDYTLSQMCN